MCGRGIADCLGSWHVVALLSLAFWVELPASTTAATPPGWRLVWSDDFDVLDEQKWTRVRSLLPTNNAKQVYQPDQIGVRDGNLVIPLGQKPADGQAFGLREVTSTHARRYGRWEVRARIPTGRGIQSMIRLLPVQSSTSPYEIDVMSSRGDRPTVTASGCHWGRDTPASDDEIVLEQQTSLAGRLVSYPDAFHTFAVEWLDDQLRFYVDDVYHGVLYADEVGGFFSRHTGPMQLVIGTAVGGDSSPEADETTVWPQRFLVDWVRVHERSDEPVAHVLRNGGFEENGGSLTTWHVFGSRVNGDPNVLAHREAVKNGNASLRLFGPQNGGESFSGVTQGISVSGGQRVRARLAALTRSADSLAKTGNRVFMKIEFYNKWGDYFGGPAMLGFKERVIADRSTPTDIWKEHELEAQAPGGAVEARLSIVFAQRANEAGSLHIDCVECATVD